MRPGGRTEGEVFALPQCSLAQGDVEGCLHEWRGFPDACRECFARREPREQFFGDMVGQFRALERQAIEPMARQVDGGNVRARQRLISDVVWDDAPMRQQYHRVLQEDRGDAEGVVIFDASGVPKKGQESVGGARQSCGTLGQGENCQVGMCAA